jgi:prepilin-type N-terminal cleavage/methylation domain-containing protein
MHCRAANAGFTLVEVLMVVLVVSVLAALALPSMNPSIHDRLQTAAQVVAADMAYGRSLAVTNNDSYTFTFSVSSNQYTLTYAGSNSALATLPSSPFYSVADTPKSQVTNLANLPTVGGPVQLYAVGTNSSSPAATTQITFGQYGQTTQTAETDIWLTDGDGSLQRYIMVAVNPVTGLASIENFQAGPPPAAIVTGS